MPQPIGRCIPLSLPRRFMGDLVHFAQQVPQAAVQRCMNLAPVVAARRMAGCWPGWCALFTKAYALIAARRPELRRVYVPFSRAHLYEHPVNVASVGIERSLGDEDAVFFCHVRGPEQQGLGDIEKHLRRCKEGPLEKIGLFRRLLTVSRLPRPLRRLLWRIALNTSGQRRARYLGTFGISSVSNLGATAHLPSPWTTALSYGMVAENGSVEVRLTYDPRVLDGGTAARALEELEQVLHSEILTELRYLEVVDAA